MKQIHLYIKKHDRTGLLYFGTTSQNPITYKGSGKAWKRHLKEHGRTISTIWLKSFTEDDPRLIKYARRITKWCKIVESENFANNLPEVGKIITRTLPSSEYLHECFEYKDTGELFWKLRPLEHFKNSHRMNIFNANYGGKLAGNSSHKHKIYHSISINSTIYKTHRIIFKMHHMIEPPSHIDHIDGDIHNNCIENLRIANPSTNIMNANIRNDNSTGYKGISKKSGKYVARIQNNGKRHYLGSFETLEDAKKAYDKAAIKYHGIYRNNI